MIPPFFRVSRRGCLVSLGALCLAASMSRATAQSVEPAAPRRGQPGKDVMWLPTADALMTRMLEVARVNRDDLVYDLGAGDGKIAIAAAQRFGARAVGIEYNAALAAYAQRNVERAGLSDRVRIQQGDIFREDFSQATVLTLYLLEELNQQLRPSILAMRPGTRVVSNTFSMGDWEPDEVIVVGTQTGYYWKVPAIVAGRWRWPSSQGREDGVIEIMQRHQRIAGSLMQAGRTQALLGPELDGDQLRLRFIDEHGLMRVLQARVAGDRLEGEVLAPWGMPAEGVHPPPQPVRATRERP